MDNTTRGISDDAGADRSTTALRAEIDQTREELSETIDAIQEKLRPSNIVAEATNRIKDATTERVRQMAGTASETAQSAIDQTRQVAGEFADGARQNAVPAAMIGIGMAWLLVDRIRNGTKRDETRHREFASSPRTPGYMASDEYYRRDTSSGYAGDAEGFGGATHLASDARDAAVRTGRRARNQFQRVLRNNPLMVGAAAMVMGAAVGMLLPETERENELLGETRDNVVDRAQDLARNAATRVRDAAGDIAGQVTSEVVSGKDTQT